MQMPNYFMGILNNTVQILEVPFFAHRQISISRINLGGKVGIWTGLWMRYIFICVQQSSQNRASTGTQRYQVELHIFGLFFFFFSSNLVCVVPFGYLNIGRLWNFLKEISSECLRDKEVLTSIEYPLKNRKWENLTSNIFNVLKKYTQRIYSERL